MNPPTLLQACSQGRLCLEDWLDSLLALTDNPDFSNSELLQIVQQSSRYLPAVEQSEWLYALLEYCVCSTTAVPERLDLCDYLYREYRLSLIHPQRIREYGSILHLACETGHIDSVRWILERCPSLASLRGGRLSKTPFHALCQRPLLYGTDDQHESDALEIAQLLLSYRANPHDLNSEGRNLLFYVHSPALTRFFLDQGLSPFQVDPRGYSPLGFQIENSLFSVVEVVFQYYPDAINQFTSWGSSLTSSSLRNSQSTPCLYYHEDRPLFILSHQFFFRPDYFFVYSFSDILTSFYRWGANPLLPDSNHHHLWDRFPSHEAIHSLVGDAQFRLVSSDILTEAESSTPRRL